MAGKIYDIVQISKLIKEKFKQEFPNFTFSVTTKRFSGGQSIDVDLLKGDVKFFKDEERKNLDIAYISRSGNYEDILTEEGFKVAKRIVEIVNENNWDNSDPMTDYFDVNYYTHVSIGRYNKPYEYIQPKSSTKSYPKKSVPAPSPEKSSGETNAESELLMTFSQGWSLYKTTINKKDYDGNPITLIVYNLNKNKDLKNIPYDKFLEFKGEMLTTLGMKWGKFQKFERWSFPPDNDILKVVIDKYYGVGETKEETPAPATEQKDEFKVGDKIIVVENGKVFTIKSIGAGGVTNVVYEDGTPAAFFPRQLTNGLKNGSLKLIDFQVYDKYLEPKTKYTFVIDKITDDAISTIYSDGIAGYIPIDKFVKGIASGYYVKILDEEKQDKKQELPFKVGDNIYNKNTPQNINTIIKIEESTDFFQFETNDGRKLQGSLKNTIEDVENGDLIVIKKQESVSEDDIKKAISALEILAEDGDEDARKGIEALKILLN